MTCFTLLCVTGMSCKFRFGLVESNKKEETLKGLLCPGEWMAPKLGDSGCPSRLEWQASIGVQGRELSRGAWLAPG